MRSIISRIMTPRVISRIKIFALRNAFLTKMFCLRYFSLNEMDKQLESYLDFDNGFFVECGANDGVDQSNTLFFEHFRGWRGILIEPHPSTFKSLTRNRSPKNYFKNAACVGPEFKSQKVKLIYSNLMTSTLGIESDLPNPIDHAFRGSKFSGGEVFVFEAPALTLDQVLNEANAPSLIDLISLDVEGAEIEILRGVNHEKYKFRYICIEARRFDRVSTYLLQHGYVFVSKLTDHDYLFKYELGENQNLS